MICMYEIRARCFRDYQNRTFARIRRSCSRVGRVFCGTRLKFERFLTGRRREIEEERQHEVRTG